MKIHYVQPFMLSAICGNKNSDRLVDDYQHATCLQCIGSMSPGEQMWHDTNNLEWIKHKAEDGRRKGVGGKTKMVISESPHVVEESTDDHEWIEIEDSFIQENWKFLVCMFFILVLVMWCAL